MHFNIFGFPGIDHTHFSWKHKLLNAVLLYISMQNMSTDEKNVIYSDNIISRINELIRRLLSGLTASELKNLV